MTDEAKRMLTYFEDHTGMCVIEGTDAEHRPTLSAQACGDAALTARRALFGVPGSDEYEIEPCPTFHDPGAVLVTLDGASVLVEPGQWSVTPCESFVEQINDEMHHDDMKQLAHLLLYACGIAREAEEAHTAECRRQRETNA